MPTTPATATITPAASPDTAIQRFRHALATGNPRLVRAAAAQLPHIGLAEAAAILLVIEQTEPDNYDQTALRWLATLATEARHLDLPTIAGIADALNALPHQPPARADLARLCNHARLPHVAAIFAPDHPTPPLPDKESIQGPA